MRFGVQSITKILTEDGKSISHYEVDLVDIESTDWQSSITLRVHRSNVEHYYVGQMFWLSPDRSSEKIHTYQFNKFHFGYEEPNDNDTE